MTKSLSIRTKLDFSTGYTAPLGLLDIDPKSHEIKIKLKDGKHRFVSKPINIGTIEAYYGKALEVSLAFDYSYDSKTGNIHIADTNFDSPETIVLLSSPCGSSETCTHRVIGGHFEADLNDNPNWVIHEAKYPGFHQMCKTAIVWAHKELCNALNAIEDVRLHLKRPLPELSGTDYRNLMGVYIENEFIEAFDPEKDYEGKHRIVGVESTFGGVVTLNNGENFANVIGSSRDRPIAGLSWIRLWGGDCNNFVYPNICTSDGYPAHFVCSNHNLVGGHIIAGITASTVPYGSNSVYILPICHNHNMDDHIHMKALQYHIGVWLKNYHNP